MKGPGHVILSYSHLGSIAVRGEIIIVPSSFEKMVATIGVTYCFVANREIPSHTRHMMTPVIV